MGLQAKIASTVRWVITWPVLVIIALNIENAISEAGYGTIINQHWKDTAPVLNGIYAAATSPWIWNPTLIILGAVAYEWVTHTVIKIESDGSNFQRWLVKQGAENLASAFMRNGLFRRMTNGREIEKLNRRLSAFNLPTIPPEIGADEADNATVGSYLALVAQGQFAHARTFLTAATLDLDSETQSPEGTGPETQP